MQTQQTINTTKVQKLTTPHMPSLKAKRMPEVSWPALSVHWNEHSSAVAKHATDGFDDHEEVCHSRRFKNEQLLVSLLVHSLDHSITQLTCARMCACVCMRMRVCVCGGCKVLDASA